MDASLAGPAIQIRPDDLSSEAIKSLLQLHLSAMQATSPPGSVFALDLSGLKDPLVTVWSAWTEGNLASMGALKVLGSGHGEIKSMRTHPALLRQGIGAALLEHIIDEARRRGIVRLSLETGSGPAFEPALALYRRRGFMGGQAFSNYVASDFNQFLHLDL